MDVTGFTGGSTVGGNEYVRRSKPTTTKPSITSSEAETQIAALKQVILQESMLGPGQVAAGQLVTSQLKFGKKEDRTLHVRVRVAGEEHSFTIEAPKG
jgi:light-regulated signal transduction histidine kinase (bacteriophytochrome)